MMGVLANGCEPKRSWDNEPACSFLVVVLGFATGSRQAPWICMAFGPEARRWAAP